MNIKELNEFSSNLLEDMEKYKKGEIKGFSLVVLMNQVIKLLDMKELKPLLGEERYKGMVKVMTEFKSILAKDIIKYYENKMERA